MGLQKNELIEKLQEISMLCDKVREIKREMNTFVPQDNYPRKVVVPVFPGEYSDEEEREGWETGFEHEEKDAIDQIAKAYDRCYSPKKPEKPVVKKCQDSVTVEVDKLKKKMGGILLIAIVAGVMALFTAIYARDSLTAVLNWGLVVICAVVVGRYYVRLSKAKASDAKLLEEMQIQHNQEVEEKNKEYEEAIRLYEEEMISYKLRRQDFLDGYTAWRKAYLESLAEEKKIREMLESDRQTAVDQIRKEKLIPAMRELDETNDLFPKDYLDAIDLIINLLKSDRADTIKEAINLFEDLIYRERQLKLQREQEEQRRYEEELRSQEETRRYYEEKFFREEQEMNRKIEAERLEREADRRHREEMRQREDQERQRRYEEDKRIKEEQRREEKAYYEQKQQEARATHRQCNTCALCGHCSMAFMRPNCASYTPR